MSQRLHVGETNNPIYDCVIDHDTINVREKLLYEWAAYKDGWTLGPYNIRISDILLYKKIEPDIADLFKTLSLEYPDDVWGFFVNGNRILDHPTRGELDFALSTLEL